MAEFKGTKGKWIDRSHLSKDVTHIVRRIDTEDGTSICIVRTNNQEQAEYNALLISKAPEMLEALKDLVKQNEFRGYGEADDVLRAKQLIKEATELKD